MTDILDVMLADESFSVIFQPIFDVTAERAELWAVEALTRGPLGTHFESASVLFDYVRLKRDEVRVDRYCCENAITAAARLGVQHVLTLNAHASTLERDRTFPSLVLSACEAAGFPPDRLVMEIVEQVPYFDTVSLRASLTELRAAGVRLAVDDLGFGHGNLRMFLDVRPDYVKVERYFVDGCAADADRRILLRAIQSLASDFGTKVIAEGVEQTNDLEVIRELGIGLAQGFLLGRPSIHINPVADVDVARAQKEQTCSGKRSFA
jgi:EAL domain-containing protein (putative c-di-GMP-specific phosphodiesterase class I)